MAFIPVPDVAQVNLRYTLAGQQVENTLYFLFPSTPGSADLLDLATYCRGWRDVSLKPIQGSHCLLREVYAVSLTSATAPTATYVESPAEPGDYTGTPLPNNVTIAVSFRTEGRGRSSRGRNFALGLTETALSSTLGQTVQSTYEADLIAAYQELIDTPPTDLTWVVVSRYTDGAPRTTGIYIPITSVILTDTTIDSQRRRLPGRGA